MPDERPKGRVTKPHPEEAAANGRPRRSPFPDRLRELKTWISEESGPEASVAALMAVAPYFEIAAPQAKRILGDVEAAVARWRDRGRALGMTEAELEQFADAFEHEERSAARRAIAERPSGPPRPQGARGKAAGGRSRKVRRQP